MGRDHRLVGGPVLKGQPDRISPVLPHRSPPGMLVSLRMTGAKSGGGDLVASKLMNRALHFGSYWLGGRSVSRYWPLR